MKEKEEDLLTRTVRTRKKTQPSTANAESIEEALRRISKKPGVRAWLMLDRSTGAVLRTNGHVAAVRPARSLAAAPSSSSSSAAQSNPNAGTGTGTGGDNNNNNNNGGGGENASGDPTTPSATAFPTVTGPGTVAVAAPEGGVGAGAGASANAGVNPETQAATELAALVWGFLGTAGGLVGEMDSEVGFCFCGAPRGDAGWRLLLVGFLSWRDRR